MDTESIKKPELESRAKARKAQRKRKRIIIGSIIGVVALVVIAVVVGVKLYYNKTVVVAKAPEYIGSNQELQEGCTGLEGLNCTAKWKIDEEHDKGTLLEQTIKPGERVKKGRAIEVVYSGGKENPSLPELEGLSVEEAKEKLYALGLYIGKTSTVESEGTPFGTIVKVYAEKSSKLRNGDMIDVDISSGSYAIPDWTGKPKEYVEAEAKKARLEVEFKEEESESVTAGTVISQTPKPGEAISVPGKIQVVIAKKAEAVEISVPDVIGKTDTQAQTALAEAGFRHIQTVVVKNNEVDSKQVTQVVPGVGQSVMSTSNVVLIVSEPIEK